MAIETLLAACFLCISAAASTTTHNVTTSSVDYEYLSSGVATSSVRTPNTESESVSEVMLVRTQSRQFGSTMSYSTWAADSVTDDTGIITTDGWWSLVSEDPTEGEQGGPGGGGGGFRGGAGGVPETSACKLFSFMMSVVIVGPITLFGLIGNSLSFYALWPQRNSNATAFLLMSLAVFDTVTSVTWTFIKASGAICKFFDVGAHYMSHVAPYTWSYGYPGASIFHMSATWTVVFVTLHRFIAACYPLLASKYATVEIAKQQVAATFVSCLLYSIPRFCERRVVDRPWRAVVILRPYATNPAYEYAYQVGLYYLLAFFVPFMALSVMTWKLVKALAQAKAKRQEMTAMKRDESDITKTLIAVVVIFMVCQISNPIRRVMAAVWDSKAEQGCGSPYFYFVEFSNLLTQFNASVNFVIYCIFGKRFRQNLVARLTRRNKVVPIVGGKSNATQSSRLGV